MKHNTENSTRKKTVAMVLPAMSTGGAEKLVYDIICHINPELYELVLITLYKNQDCLRIQDIKKRGIRIISLDKNRGLDLKCFLKMARALRCVNPDIIHSHLDVLLYLLPSFKCRQIKLHTIHSVAHFEAVGFQKFIRKIAFRLFGVRPVAIGTTVAASVAEYYDLPKKQIPVVYNGVHIENKEPSPAEGDWITFVSVGTLYYVKNHRLLLQAFKNCTDKSARPLRLKLVGTGVLREELEELAETLGIRNLVEFVGWCDDVSQQLNMSSVYVCSSLVEGVSLSILEAMACGLPIIASNVGGNVELVQNGVNGMLFDNEDLSALTACMLEMANCDELRCKAGEQSFIMSKQFDIKKCVQAYEGLYNAK